MDAKVQKHNDCLERADIPWCAIGGVAVNHWAAEPMVTQDVDFVVATDAIDRAVAVLTEAGFRPERFQLSINFKGHSRVSLQLSTEDFYRDFPTRAVPADVHGILLRVASLEDTLKGKIKAWSDAARRSRLAWTLAFPAGKARPLPHQKIAWLSARRACTPGKLRLLPRPRGGRRRRRHRRPLSHRR
jgi:hypothetical protein